MGAHPDWIVVDGRPDLHMEFLTEEHGVGRREGEQKLRIGDRLAMIPGHICTTVNMFDVAYGVRGGGVEEEIRIAARGKVR
jgi:D-serine deaminase-like pyridoxal phosphate-dependent protein